MVKAVFLDRDGTINEERGYLRELEQLVLIKGAANAIKKLNDAGFLVILTTNQSGPARGYYPESHVLALNKRLEKLLKDESGAFLDAIFYSPCLPNAEVELYRKDDPDRKPGIGMVQKACQQFPQINLSQSYIIGDKATDVEFAKNAGCIGVLLKTGYGQQVLDGTYQKLLVEPDWICDDLPQAIDQILERHLKQNASLTSTLKQN
jgi:D-glycero-D-manno-heptose 1,7-bisphosphate phosphatase